MLLTLNIQSDISPEKFISSSITARTAIQDMQSNGKAHAKTKRNKGENRPCMDLGGSIVCEDSIGGNLKFEV